MSTKVTQEQVLDLISSEHFFTAYQGAKGQRPTRDEPKDSEALKLLTICVLVLKNGFTVTGFSGCVDPANFDEKIGKEIALRKATEQIWPLLGYQLKDNMYMNQNKEGDLNSGD